METIIAISIAYSVGALLIMWSVVSEKPVEKPRKPTYAEWKAQRGL